MQTGGLTGLLFRVRTTRGFFGMTEFPGPELGRTASTTDRLARPLTSARLLLAICALLALGACGSDDSAVIPPFTLTFSVAAGDLNGDGRPDLASANTFIAGPPPTSRSCVGISAQAVLPWRFWRC